MPEAPRVLAPEAYRRGVAFFFDTNVCIDIEDAANGKTNDASKARLTALIARIATLNAEIVPAFGLLERALDAEKSVLNRERYDKEALSFPSKWARVERMCLGVNGPDRSVTLPEADFAATVAHMTGKVRPIFASFLKIFQIQEANPTALPIEKLRQYLDWAINDLDCIAVFAAQTAIAFFADDSDAIRMLGFKKKGPYKGAWGAAYDSLLLAFAHQLHFTTVADRPFVIFVTNDRAAAMIMRRCRVFGAITDGPSIVTTVNQMDLEFPSYPDLRPIEPLLDTIKRRATVPRETPPERMEMVIQGLLSEVERLWQAPVK